MIIKSTEYTVITEYSRRVGSNLAKYVDCKCKECPNIVSRRKSDIHTWSGRCRRCANLIKLEKARLVPNPADGEPYEALYNCFRKSAKERDKEVNLTFTEFVGFTCDTNCHYCYSTLQWTVRNVGKNGSRYNLDRKDNSKGYNVDNCVPCCWRCNNGRSNLFTYEEWYGMTKYLRDLNTVVEISDETDLSGELACSSGKCEI